MLSSEVGIWGDLDAVCHMFEPRCAGTRLGGTCIPAVYAAFLSVSNASALIAGQPISLLLQSSTHSSQIASWSLELLAPGSTVYMPAGSLMLGDSVGVNNLWNGTVLGTMLTQVGGEFCRQACIACMSARNGEVLKKTQTCLLLQQAGTYYVRTFADNVTYSDGSAQNSSLVVRDKHVHTPVPYNLCRDKVRSDSYPVLRGGELRRSHLTWHRQQLWLPSRATLSPQATRMVMPLGLTSLSTSPCLTHTITVQPRLLV